MAQVRQDPPLVMTGTPRNRVFVLVVRRRVEDTHDAQHKSVMLIKSERRGKGGLAIPARRILLDQTLFACNYGFGGFSDHRTREVSGRGLHWYDSRTDPRL